MKDYKYSCGIVLYNPDINKLVENTNELLKMFNRIYFIDNGSNNIDEVVKYSPNEVIIIRNSENKGISYALNQLIDLAYNDSSDFLLTLDQDSFFSNECFNNMIKYTNLNNVCLISPVINDVNKHKEINFDSEFDYVNRCITSGTLMNLKLCKEVGYFDEKMFIDYVDFDYCKRVILSGYKIIRVNNAIINHEIGKRLTRRFLLFTVYPTNHSPFRVYYYARNIKYYLRKFKSDLSLKEKLIEYKYLIWKYISILLYEDNKSEKLKKYRLGIKDSKTM